MEHSLAPEDVVLGIAGDGLPPKVGQASRPQGPVDPASVLVPGRAAPATSEHPELHHASHHGLKRESLN